MRQQDASLAALQSQNRELDTALQQTRAELDAANLEVNAATAQFNEMARQIALLNEALAQQRRASDAALAQLESARSEIAALTDTSSQQQQTISQLNTERERLSQEISAYNQQLLTLKGEYETVKSQYEELIKPARSAKGKYIAQVYYVKDDSGDVIRYRQPGDKGFSRLSLAEVEQRLAKLKAEQGENLYVKIIIPDNSGLTYNEAWEFMRKLLVKYDYYYQE
jgi:chromosome segregation ATPase